MTGGSRLVGLVHHLVVQEGVGQTFAAGGCGVGSHRLFFSIWLHVGKLKFRMLTVHWFKSQFIFIS